MVEGDKIGTATVAKVSRVWNPVESFLPELPKRSNKYAAKQVYRAGDGSFVIRSGRTFTSLSGVPIEPVQPVKKVADSISEWRRWCELTALAAAGKIHGLRQQVRFHLHGLKGTKLCDYVADFVYIEDGRQVVEDRKGMKTPMYRLKKKWMADEYGITIRET